MCHRGCTQVLRQVCGFMNMYVHVSWCHGFVNTDIWAWTTFYCSSYSLVSLNAKCSRTVLDLDIDSVHIQERCGSVRRTLHARFDPDRCQHWAKPGQSTQKQTHLRSCSYLERKTCGLWLRVGEDEYILTSGRFTRPPEVQSRGKMSVQRRGDRPCEEDARSQDGVRVHYKPWCQG